MATVINVTPDDNWFTGEDKGIPILLLQSDGTTRRDITDATLSYMVKRRKTDPDSRAVIRVTTSDGSGKLAKMDPANGELQLTLLSSDIKRIRGGALYYHELKRVDAGQQAVYIEGSFMLKQAVHR